MKIYFASDHAGFEMKNALIAYVRDELGYETMDCGAFVYDENDDYPGFIHAAARNVSTHPSEHRAIILGKTGHGEAMVANRCPNVRAAEYYGGPDEIIALSREHNDANVLSLGAGFLSIDEAKHAVALWLKTEFSGNPRHIRRIKDIEHCV